MNDDDYDDNDEKFDMELEMEMTISRYGRLLLTKIITLAIDKTMSDDARRTSEEEILYLQFMINTIFNALHAKN